MNNITKTWSVFIFGFLLIMVLVVIGTQEYRTERLENRFISFIDNVQAYQDSVDIKHVENGYKDELDSNTFSTEKYLQFFTECKLPDSSTVKTFYLDNFSDGKPYIIAMDTNHLNRNYELLKRNNFRYKLHKNDSIHRLFYDFVTVEKLRAKNKITPTNSEMGYLQYLFFHEFGELFALKWHESYNDKEILTGGWKIDSIENEIRDLHSVFTDLDSLVMLKELDFTPDFVWNKESVEISVVEHRTYYGIYRTTYQIMRDPPYEVIMTDDKKLLTFTPRFIF